MNEHFARRVFTKHHKILTVERMPMLALFLHHTHTLYLQYAHFIVIANAVWRTSLSLSGIGHWGRGVHTRMKHKHFIPHFYSGSIGITVLLLHQIDFVYTKCSPFLELNFHTSILSAHMQCT